MRRRTLWVAAAALLAAACADHKTAAERRPVPVTVVTAEDGSAGGSRSYVGSVEGAAAVPVSFGNGGVVTMIAAREGQRVKAGDLIGSVDSRNAAEACNAAKATLEQARDAYGRARMVHEKGSLPDIKWVEVETRLNQAQSTYNIARQSLEDCRLYAPVGGTVCRVRAEVGSRMAPGVPVMEIVDLSRLYVRMSVPEVDMALIRQGTPVTVDINALAEQGGRGLKGTVESIDVSPDEVSHCYSCRVELRRTPAGALPGMVCGCRIWGGDRSSGIELPGRAVQLANDGSRYVWVAADSTARRRAVVIGDLTATGVLVTDGIAAGEKVIVDGVLKLSEGTRVCY